MLRIGHTAPLVLMSRGRSALLSGRPSARWIVGAGRPGQCRHKIGQRGDGGDRGGTHLRRSLREPASPELVDAREVLVRGRRSRRARPCARHPSGGLVPRARAPRGCAAPCSRFCAQGPSPRRSVLVARVGTRATAVLSLGLSTLALLTLLTISATSPYGVMAVAFVVLAMGTGMTITAGAEAIVGSAPPSTWQESPAVSSPPASRSAAPSAPPSCP